MQTLTSTVNAGYPVAGSVAFRNVVDYLARNLCIIFVPPLEGERLLGLLGHIRDHFTVACAADKSDFGHYFRTLYHLIEFVDKSSIKDKAYYVGLVRAQLSTDEIALIFYNGLSEQGWGFKLLIERYALLKNWRMQEAFQAHKCLYADEAYGD